MMNILRKWILRIGESFADMRIAFGTISFVYYHFTEQDRRYNSTASTGDETERVNVFAIELA